MRHNKKNILPIDVKNFNRKHSVMLLDMKSNDLKEFKNTNNDTVNKNLDSLNPVLPCNVLSLENEIQ